MISTARAVLGAAVLIAATAAVTAIVLSKWDNLFPPTDYEDCAARAAKDTSSTDALSVLVSLCDSEFKGRRKPGGGYTYYNSCPGHRSDLGRTFDIRGSNPTSDEQKYMEGRCLAAQEADERIEQQLAEEQAEAARKAAAQQAEAARKAQLALAYQAAQERAAAAAAASALQQRKSQTLPAVHATVGSSKCALFNLFPGRKCDQPGDAIDMQIEVSNQSKEALSAVLIGLAIAPPNGVCPSSYALTRRLEIPLSSGETRISTIGIDATFSIHPVCVKVMDVQFAG